MKSLETNKGPCFLDVYIANCLLLLIIIYYNEVFYFTETPEPVYVHTKTLNKHQTEFLC